MNCNSDIGLDLNYLNRQVWGNALNQSIPDKHTLASRSLTTGLHDTATR